MMKRTMRAISAIFTTIVALTILTTSCQHKELCYDHNHTTKIDVRVDWKATVNSNPDIIGVWFFPLDHQGDAQFYQFANITGGTIEIAPGRYAALCMNDDSELIRYRNTNSPNTFEIYTAETSVLSPLNLMSGSAPQTSSGEETAITPTTVTWSDYVEEVVIIADYKGVQVIPFDMHRITPHYSIEVNNVKNLKYVSDVSASVAGLSPSYFPCLQQPSSLRGTVPFLCSTIGESQIIGDFTCFGTSFNSNNKRYLVIYMILADGSKWYHEFDVTDQVNQAPDPMNVHIVIDKLNLPKPITNGGGFAPTIDDWNTVEEELNM